MEGRAFAHPTVPFDRNGLRRRRVGVAARHKEIHGKLGAELLRARDVEGALADRGELVAHAAVEIPILAA
jgi:hypothetical protein